MSEPLYPVISTEVENGASGASDMDCIAAWEAGSESGDERIKSLTPHRKNDLEMSRLRST
jgi:hypothetical protein